MSYLSGQSGKVDAYHKNMQKSAEAANEIMSERTKAAESAMKNFLTDKKDGRAIKSKFHTKAAILFNQIEQAEKAKAAESFSTATGNYMTGTGAGPIDGMGAMMTVPSVSSKVVKRVLTESAFLGEVVEFQPMQQLQGMILAVRMTVGRFGEPGLDNLNNELGRPLNNFIQVGGFKLLLQATVTASVITVEDEETLVVGGKNYAITFTGGKISGVSVGAATTEGTAAGAGDVNVATLLSSRLIGKAVGAVIPAVATINKCRLVDGGFKEPLRILSSNYSAVGTGVEGDVIIGIEPHMALTKTQTVKAGTSTMDIDFVVDYAALITFIKNNIKPATITGDDYARYGVDFPMYPDRVQHKRRGQFYYALDNETKNFLFSGALDDAMAAEMYMKGVFQTGFGLNPDYALTLGSYGEDIDPNRTIADMAAGSFTGMGIDANGNFTVTRDADGGFGDGLGYDTNIEGGALAGTEWLGGANSKFMQIQPRIQPKHFTAKERATSSEIVRNLEEDVAKAIGIDYQGIIVEQLKKLIIENMDLEILNHMKLTALDVKNGGARPKLFNFQPSSQTGWPAGNEVQGLWLQQKITTLITSLVERGENIHKATNRAGRGDFGIVTPLTAAILISGGSIYNNFDIKDNRSDNSPKIGNIAGYEIFSDIWGEMNDVNTGKFTGFSQMLIGMKAKGTGESGVFVGMYKPVTVDGPVQGFGHHNKSILVTTRYGVVSNILDAGAYYRTVMINGIEESIYGYEE